MRNSMLYLDFGTSVVCVCFSHSWINGEMFVSNWLHFSHSGWADAHSSMGNMSEQSLQPQLFLQILVNEVISNWDFDMSAFMEQLVAHQGKKRSKIIVRSLLPIYCRMTTQFVLVNVRNKSSNTRLQQIQHFVWKFEPFFFSGSFANY